MFSDSLSCSISLFSSTQPVLCL